MKHEHIIGYRNTGDEEIIGITKKDFPLRVSGFNWETCLFCPKCGEKNKEWGE